MSAKDNAPYNFHFGPFHILSELDIPELANAAPVPTPITVTLTLGNAPQDLPAAANFGALCQINPTEYLLNIPSVARFYVRNGNEIRVVTAPGPPSPDVSGFLLGSVFGALCHQNGFLPLHASAVEARGRVTAFLGESGAGKSTLAASLQRRGLPVVADDICLLASEPAANAMRVIPVAAWLKLRRQSLDHLGQTPDERNRVFLADDKYRLYLPPGTLPVPASPPTTLANLVFLTRAGTPTQKPIIEPLSTVETIAGMMRLTYLGYITELTGSHARVFAQCAHVLNQARGYRLTVPWDLTQIDSTLDLLEATIFVHEA